MNKISGVYKIRNTITGDFYIGSSINIKQRWKTHRNRAVWKRHSNSRMYQDMAKYGLNIFRFEIIEETDNLREKEQYWIEQLKPTYNNYQANGIDIERRKESKRKAACKSMKRYNNQLCLYNGETLKLNALAQRFYIAGIEHPTQEAKKYLVSNTTN